MKTDLWSEWPVEKRPCLNPFAFYIVLHFFSLTFFQVVIVFFFKTWAVSESVEDAGKKEPFATPGGETNHRLIFTSGPKRVLIVYSRPGAYVFLPPLSMNGVLCLSFTFFVAAVFVF